MKLNYFLLCILTFSLNAQTPFTSSITPDLSAYGEAISYPGQGEYQIFLDTQDGVLDKPIFLIDGFDPLNTRPIADIYNLLSFNEGTENLGDNIRDLGFDVVILNFPVYTRPEDGAIIDGGADFIERNAMLLVELVNIINAQKVGNEPNVIIGPSMGGLISRYALNYMENQSLEHDTRLWLSFDVPHLGANVPLGLQHQFNYLAFGLGDGLNITELQPLINNFLKSAAARQMLTDHFEAHLQDGSTFEFDTSKLLPVAHPYRATFINSLNGLTTSGFPEDTRNVAMINGSGIGNPYFAEGNTGPTVTNGYTALDLFIPEVAPFTFAEFEVKLTPETALGSQLISRIQITFDLVVPIDIVNTSANAQAFSYSDGIDAAPGGLFDLSALTEGFDPEPGSITEQFLDALAIDKFNFIPSVSGMALEATDDEINWHHDIDLGEGSPPGGDTINETPFINWYMPDDNQPHVQLTEDNVAFALSEIIPETLSNPNFDLIDIKIEKNPIDNKLVLLSGEAYNKAQIRITDITGKIVYNETSSLTLRTQIPLSVVSGMYVLNIKTDAGQFQSKLLVK